MLKESCIIHRNGFKVCVYAQNCCRLHLHTSYSCSSCKQSGSRCVLLPPPLRQHTSHRFKLLHLLLHGGRKLAACALSHCCMCVQQQNLVAQQKGSVWRGGATQNENSTYKACVVHITTAFPLCGRPSVRKSNTRIQTTTEAFNKAGSRFTASYMHPFSDFCCRIC